MGRQSVSAAVLLAGLSLAFGGGAAAGEDDDVPLPPATFPAAGQQALRLMAAPRSGLPASALPEVPLPGDTGPAGAPPTVPRPLQGSPALTMPGPQPGAPKLRPAPTLAERPQPALPPAFRILNPLPRPGPGPFRVRPARPPFANVLTPPAPVSQLPALTVEKHGPPSVRVGQAAVFEIIVRNQGTAPASGLRVEDELPPGARLVGTVPAALVQGQHLTWLLPALGPGQEGQFRIDLLPAAAGALASRATVSQILAATSAQTQVLAPTLSVRVQAPEGAVVGQNVNVKIRLLSLDGQPIRGVVLQVLLSEGLGHEAGNKIEAGPLDIEGELVKDIDLHVRAVRPGRQVLEAVAMAQGQETRNQAAVLVTEAGPPPRPRPSLVIHKNGTQRPTVGEQCEYHLEVENRGPTGLANVTLFDRLPDGLERVSESSGGIYDIVSRTVQWRLGLLEPGQKRAVSLRVRAKRVGEQVNQVWATAEPGQEARLTATMQVDGRGGSPAAGKNR